MRRGRAALGRAALVVVLSAGSLGSTCRVHFCSGDCDEDEDEDGGQQGGGSATLLVLRPCDPLGRPSSAPALIVPAGRPALRQEARPR